MTGTRFTTLAVLLLVVLLLAGCGGDDGVSQSVHDQTMADLEQAQQDLMDAEGERDQAQQDLMDAEGERDQAQQDLMDAEGERDQAQQDVMDAEGERDQAQQDLMDAQDDADMQQAMADSAAAKELLNMALVNVLVDTDTTTDGLQPAAPTVALSVSNDGMLTASAGGYAMADMPPDMIEGWRGAMLSSGGDTAVVYSDIGNDGTQSLLDRYESTRPTGGAPRMWTVGTTDTDAMKYIQWSSVMRPDDSSSFSGAPGATMLTFMGTVHNIPGTFSCSATAIDTCRAPARYSDGSVETDSTNTAAFAAGTWAFVPDEGVATFTDDMDYLVFGWWLDKGADGLPDYLRLITAAQGMTARTSGNTSGETIFGKATYKGGAAGKYAVASDTADVYEGGHFTADATLMVDFDADDTSSGFTDNEGIAISGMIDNFMTGDMARPNWMVKLMVDRTGARGVQTIQNLLQGAARTTEWSMGGAQKGTGTWTAQWYGGEAAEHPMAATGTFNAHVGTGANAVGRIQGAFGVNKMMDE